MSMSGVVSQRPLVVASSQFDGWPLSIRAAHKCHTSYFGNSQRVFNARRRAPSKHEPCNLWTSRMLRPPVPLCSLEAWQRAYRRTVVHEPTQRRRACPPGRLPFGRINRQRITQALRQTIGVRLWLSFPSAGLYLFDEFRSNLSPCIRRNWTCDVSGNRMLGGDCPLGPSGCVERAVPLVGDARLNPAFSTAEI